MAAEIILVLHVRPSEVDEAVVHDYMTTPKFLHYLENSEVRCCSNRLHLEHITIVGCVFYSHLM